MLRPEGVALPRPMKEPTVLTDLTIAIIGTGVMGEAIISGLLREHLIAPDRIIAADPRRERRAEIAARYGVHTTEDNAEAACAAELAIFSVKPQNLTSALPELHRRLRPEAVVLSIVAGTPVRHFVDALGHAAVVRSMPNTPAQIGAGMTVWTASDETSEQQRGWAKLVLGALGRELYVADESFLDVATAINGTGPAYIFMMLEAMVDAGVHLGLSRYVAEELVLQTMLGSALYAQQTGKHPAELRNAVTSPGGTTAAAMYELEKGGLRTVLTDAIWAAYRRSVELGKTRT